MPAVVNIAVVTDAHEGVISTPGHLLVSRTDDALSQPLTVQIQVSGTATPGVDYQALLGSVEIPAGQVSAPIVIQPIDDLVPELPESVIVTLAADPAYQLGEASQATVNIRNTETVAMIAGTSLTFVVGYTVQDTTELPVLTAEVLPFGASFDIVHSEAHPEAVPPNAHTFGQFSWTPLLEQVGSHEVVFRVTVPGTEIDETSSLTIIVLPNFPPLVNVGGSSGTEIDSQTQQFTWSAVDDVGLAFVSATVTQDGNPIFSSSDAAGNFNFDAYGPGTFGITVTAFDTTGQPATANQSVTVSDDDTQGPTIVLGGSTGTENEAQLQEFTWDVSDDSGLSVLAVVITQDTGSGAVEILRTEDLADAAGSFNFDSFGAGTFAITVTATDGDNDWSGDGSQSSATRSVTVTAGNNPPVLIVPGPVTVSEGQTLTFQVSASDSDGDPLTFTVNNLPIGATFDPESLRFDSVTQTWSQTFRWTAVCDQAGAYQVSFGVLDGQGGEDSGQVAITVAAVPLAEQLQSLIDRVTELTDLPRNVQAPLMANLEAALRALRRNRPLQVQNHLGDAVNRLDGLIGDPAWSAESSDELQGVREAAAGLLACLQVPAPQAEIRQVTYLSRLRVPMSIRGSFGDSSRDNPNGQNGTRDFGGGVRFFPDARTYDTRETPANYVRVQVLLRNVPDGTLVYFRAFDVDDPSDTALNDQTNSIDPNGLNGGDNRGKVKGRLANTPNDLLPPGAAETGGYQGRLRAVGHVGSGVAPFAEEGAVVAVPVRNGMAEVDLATSFAPGDNFRVVVSLTPDPLRALNRTTDIPTTGDPRNAEAARLVQANRLAVTEQLSVWRHVHVEEDRMAPIRPAGQLLGRVTDPGTVDRNTRLVTISTGFAIPNQNMFRGGTFRNVNGGDRYIVVDHSSGQANATVSLFVNTPGQQGPDQRNATLTQGDFQTGRIRTIGPQLGGVFEVTTDIPIDLAHEYVGGVLRSNGRNFAILGSGVGFTGTRISVVGNRNDLDLLDPIVTLYQDDFTTNGVTLGNVFFGTALQTLPLRGQVLVRTDIPLTDRNFRGVLLDRNNRTYIVSVRGVGSGELIVDGLAAPPLGGVILVRDLAGAEPTIATDVTDDSHLYDMMQSSPSYLLNRFADAYIEPEYQALDRFDSRNVTPRTHVPGDAPLINTIFNEFRGTSPGAAPRPANYETDLFWATYVSTAFESVFLGAGDGGIPNPPNPNDPFGPAILGDTDRNPQDPRPTRQAPGQISLVYLETIRDRAAETAARFAVNLSDSEMRARTTIHEVGHQLGLAAVPGGHRNLPPNIMSSDTAAVSAEQWNFHVADVAALRFRQRSPGEL